MIMTAFTTYFPTSARSRRSSSSDKKTVRSLSSRSWWMLSKQKMRLTMPSHTLKYFTHITKVSSSKRSPTNRNSFSTRMRVQFAHQIQIHPHKFFIWRWFIPKWKTRFVSSANRWGALSSRWSGNRIIMTSGCAWSNLPAWLIVCTQWEGFRVTSCQEARKYGYRSQDQNWENSRIHQEINHSNFLDCLHLLHISNTSSKSYICT